jgi:hypothetical protein
MFQHLLMFWRQCSNIYLWRKVVCFVVMRSTQPGCFRSCSWCLWKALDKEGCMGLVPRGCKSSWILNDVFNGSWKFQRNWNVPSVLLERSWFQKTQVLKWKISWGCDNTCANGAQATLDSLVTWDQFATQKCSKLAPKFFFGLDS